jgi:nicotinate-nucleotide adenylyltransferase
MSTAGRRLGVLGGTLDPIHVGHLDAAEAARTSLGLDEVLFIPAHDPPHRPRDPHASAFHRFALAALAIDGHPTYRVSDLELRRSGASYTALTLRELHDQGWQPLQIFFIIGADAFAEIATWYDYPAILDACNFAVIPRPTSVPLPGDGGFQQPTSVPPGVDAGSREGRRLVRPSGTAIIPIDATTRAVSSSDIRARLAANQSIDALVPPAVARHIHAHGLYVRT